MNIDKLKKLGFVLFTVLFMLNTELQAANNTDPCVQASREATSLARTYQRSVRELKGTCTREGDCDLAKLAADEALDNLSLFHGEMKENCGTTTPPPEPPPSPNLAGDIIINEVMMDPDGYPEEEWIEIYNPTSTDFDLNGISFVSAGDTLFTISQSLIIPAQGFILIGKSMNTVINGGIVPDYIDTFSLYDLGVIYELKNGTTILDEVNLWGFNVSRGTSANLDPRSADAINNDILTNWCLGTSIYGIGGQTGNLGTPGSINDLCF